MASRATSIIPLNLLPTMNGPYTPQRYVGARWGNIGRSLLEPVFLCSSRERVARSAPKIINVHAARHLQGRARFIMIAEMTFVHPDATALDPKHGAPSAAAPDLLE